MNLVKVGEDPIMSYTIEVIKGDIVTVDTEAIVNAANNKFWMGSGVAGAIKAAGGESILRTTARYIRQATVKSLNLAEKLHLKSVAFPAFGTGVGGFPMAGCANIMVLAAKGFRTESKVLERVVFCLFDELGYQAFRKIADKPG